MKHIGLGLLFVISSAAILSSCGSDNGGVFQESNTPIILGDSSLIVTETDSAYLRNLVVDFTPVTAKAAEAKASNTVEESVAPGKDTVGKIAAAAIQAPEKEAPKADKPEPVAAAPKGKGLSADFKVVSFFIPNIETRTYSKQDLEKSNGASYQLVNGSINGNTLQVTSSAKISRVAMRYQTVVKLKGEHGVITLNDLSGKVSDWQSMAASKNNSYAINLSESRLLSKKPAPKEIQAAVQNEVRRMNRKIAAQWVATAKKIRTVDSKVIDVSAKYVVFLAEGKDASGKTFNKQLRIDLPL